jgi:hypothetical protein
MRPELSRALASMLEWAEFDTSLTLTVLFHAARWSAPGSNRSSLGQLQRCSTSVFFRQPFVRSASDRWLEFAHSMVRYTFVRLKPSELGDGLLDLDRFCHRVPGCGNVGYAGNLSECANSNQGWRWFYSVTCPSSVRDSCKD